ncbi:MAG: CapA family protein [Clostridiales bacterium]|nr:CapA family protein [Clostridiales bacterium]
MSKKITITASGDAMFLADFPSSYDNDLQEISNFVNLGDVKITNLETNLSKFGDFPNGYSGGTWLNTEPELFEYLLKYGFNYFGTANNHVMDYSYHGLLSTLEVLDKNGVYHSGTGKNMEEASAPSVIEVGDQKVAVFAVTADFETGSKAGYETKTMKGRPGVNYLSFNTYYQITPEMKKQLEEIAKYSQINGERNLHIQGGFVLPDGDGIFTFGSVKFCSDGSRKSTECNKKDKERIVNSIRKAKEKYDYVVILVHCHNIKGDKHENVPEFLKEFCHACIDAGVSAVIGGGTHQLRPVEIYNGCPIFYSLGDFMYQGMRVPYLPADFMEKYGLDINATAYEGLMKRSKNGTIGLQKDKNNFLTVIPKMQFENGKLISLELMPTSLGFEREGDLNGLPYHAKGEDAKEIFDILNNLSAPYGSQLELENDLITVKLK